MADTLTILSVLSFLVAGMLGTACVVLWIQFDIPEILADFRVSKHGRFTFRIRKDSSGPPRDGTEELSSIMIIHTDEVIVGEEKDK